MAYNFRPQMTNFCLPQPSFVPVKNNLKKDGTKACAQCMHGGLTWNNGTS